MEIQKNKTWNSSIFGSVIAALCIVIYLGALIQGAVRIYLSIEQSRTTADQEFSQIANIAVTAGTQSFMDERFVQTLRNAVAASKTIEGVIITGNQAAQAFEKQSGRAISWANNSPRFINRFGFSNQDYHRPLSIPNIHDASIKAVASAFDFVEFTGILQETLLLILVGFILASLTMLLQLLLGKSGRGETIYAPPPASVSPAGKGPLAVKAKEKKADAKEEPDSGPKGLYSTRSNIGWEEYTKDRLNSELHRCSSTENDLSLVIMEFPDIDNDEEFRKEAQEAVSFFTSRDLIFENGTQGISVILPGLGLDIAISKSEKFFQRIGASDLKIGLSSRSGRLINAERLILEATEALKKAKNDPSTSIIAFKSDPEKYRDYIRTRG